MWHTDLNSNLSSNYLTRVVLSISGSEVNVTCEFEDDYPEASCVLVYREYNDPYLTVEEYDRSTEFPVTISVDNTERYTFAVFGKNGTDGIEVEPVITMKNEDHVIYPPPLPPSPMALSTTMPSSPSSSPSPCEIGKSLWHHSENW